MRRIEALPRNPHACPSLCPAANPPLLVLVHTTRVVCDNTGVAVSWTTSADKHGIPREALYAIGHAYAWYDDFGDPRPGHDMTPRLYIGPSRFGTLEVLVNITPPADILIFHVMPLRKSTRRNVRYEEDR